MDYKNAELDTRKVIKNERTVKPEGMTRPIEMLLPYN